MPLWIVPTPGGHFLAFVSNWGLTRHTRTSPRLPPREWHLCREPFFNTYSCNRQTIACDGQISRSGRRLLVSVLRRHKLIRMNLAFGWINIFRLVRTTTVVVTERRLAGAWIALTCHFLCLLWHFPSLVFLPEEAIDFMRGSYYAYAG